MLSSKVAIPAAIAIAAGVAGGIARVIAAIGHFYRPIDLWPAWLELFGIVTFGLGLGTAILSYMNRPKMPVGWRPAKSWTIARLAPGTVYFGLLMLSWAVYKETSSEISEVVWKASVGTGTQFCLALIVWDHWCTWTEFTRSHGPLNGAPGRAETNR